MSYPSNINFIGDQINFMNTVNNSRINIFKNFTDSTDSTDLTNDQRNINNMFGMDSGAVLKDNPPNFNTKLDYSNLVQFYGFWGSSDSVSLAKKYVTSLEDTGKTSNNDIQNLTSLRNYNYVVTYILFIFFGNQIVIFLILQKILLDQILTLNKILLNLLKQLLILKILFLNQMVKILLY